MALSDNLLVQVYPQVGDTNIVNIVDNSTFTLSGTPTLVDEAGESAWSFPANATATLPIPEKTVNGAADNTGVTFAIRFRSPTLGTSDFNPLAGLSNSLPPSTENLFYLGKNGNTAVRSKFSNQVTLSFAGYDYANVNTLVLRVNTLASGSEYVKAWKQTVSRVGTDPDFTSIATNISASNILNYAFISALTNSQLVVLDYAYWDRELTDAECSAVADTYRAVMPAPTGGADTTPPVFSVAPATSNIQSTQADISATIDEIGDIYWVVVPQGDTDPTPSEVLAGQAFGGGSPVDSGSVLAGTSLSDTAIGLTASTAYKFVLVAQDDEPTPNVQASVTVVNFSTSAGVGTITTPSALKNNAGAIQSSVTNITARVYNQTTGALIVELTGLTSDGSGLLSFNHTSIVQGTTYNINLIAGTTLGLVIVSAFFPAIAT